MILGKHLPPVRSSVHLTVLHKEKNGFKDTGPHWGEEEAYIGDMAQERQGRLDSWN